MRELTLDHMRELTTTMQVAKKSITYKIALKYLFSAESVAQSGTLFLVSGRSPDPVT